MEKNKVEKESKNLEILIEKIRHCWVMVEGKKDKAALMQLGCPNILTISGNLKISCQKLETLKPIPDEVVILTDFDRRGKQLALLAKDELEAHSIRADLKTRFELGRILKIRYFEDVKRHYDELTQGEIHG